MHPFRLAVPLLLLACSVTEASAQQVAVRGTVRDSASNEPIPFAVVEIAGSARRFTANDRGTYSIDELAEGRWRLVAHAPGYSSAEAVVVVTADDLADIELDFVLRVGAFELEGILVQGARAPRPVAEAPIGAPPQVIDEARISAVPVAFEPDVLRVVQTLPSVAAASDFSSALYVRGATPDQTVVLLDGTPIFNPYHFAGLFSAIDVGLVDNVTAHVGPTTAALGDRLAATIEIESKAPPIVSTRGWGNVGLVSTNAGVAGPLADGGYTVAARHTYIDLITGAAHELGLMKFAFPYGFTDLYGHVRHPLVGGELRVSGYYNNEHVSPPGEEVPGLELEFDWGTGAASAIWEGILGPSVSMRGGVGFSSFTGEFLGRETDVDRPPFIDATLINRMVRPSVDFLWLAGGQDVRFGAAAELYEFGYRMSTTEEGFDIIFPELDTSSSLATVSAHVEMEWSSGVDTQWRVGLRALAANGAGLALMPRIGWSRDVGAHWSIFAAAGRKAQAVRSMRSEEAVTSSLFAYDVLAPADRLAVGDELAAGFEWQPRPTT
ncbi:MAG TPA: carboxypeptidase regulatory-like domain-containing protein, partial [Longimicrobiales bacterium]